MRTFIHLFLNLLIPLSILFIIVSIGYFTYAYDFSKALKLGILTGVLFGIGASLIIAPILLISGKVKKQEETDLEEYTQPEPESAHEVKKETKAPQQKKVMGAGKEIKCMLIMDKELAFNVLRNIPKNEMRCSVSQSDQEKGIISIQTKAGIIQTTITSLTKHTSQVIIHVGNNVKQAQTLVTHLKKKEYAFLDY